MDYIIYIIYRFFEYILYALPRVFKKPILHFLAFIVYLFAKKHNRIAKVNLDLAFGDSKSDDEKKAIIKSSYRNMLYNAYEFMVTQRQSIDEMLKKVTVENEEIILSLLKEKKKIIIVSGHYGCWEFMLPFFASHYNALSIISRPLNNKYINTIFLKAREKHNLKMCTKKGAALCMVKALRGGRVVALTIDQSINPEQSIDVDFFSHKATQVDSPVRIASKVGAVILPIMGIREDFENYKLVFKMPIEVEKNLGLVEIQKLSQKISDILEEQIIEKPNDWFWQHRRWKVYYPEMYKS